MAELAHAAEDLLDRLRLGKARITEARLDLLLEAVELFQRLAEDPSAAMDEARNLAARLSSAGGGSGADGRGSAGPAGAGAGDAPRPDRVRGAPAPRDAPAR